MSVAGVERSQAEARNTSGDHLSPSGFDYNRIQGVQGNRHVTADFIREVETIAQRIGAQPEHLLAVMSFETGGSFSPGVRNAAGSGATGLIQFMPATARELGTTTDALSRMSAVDQLEYVERYFAQRSDPGDLRTLEGVYTTVLYGSPRSEPGSTLFSQGGAAYRMNAPLDLNRDGRITAGEATRFVRGRIDGETPGTRTEPSSETAPNPASNRYTVRSGDTLGGIASRNGSSVGALMAANPQIRDSDLIYAGQRIRIPNAGNSEPAPAAETDAYTVQRGDTLGAIASRFDTGVSRLMSLNPQVRDADVIYAGQRLRVPGSGGSGNTPVDPPASSGNVPTYAPYTVYSTGHRPAFAVSDGSQLQPHHDYQTKVRNGQQLEVRDVVLHHNGQSQSRQAIPAPLEGTVIHAGAMGGAGNAVGIRAADGKVAWIFHMSSIDVRAGQRVRYGDDLGNQGSTGNSTGPHVHIEAAPAVIDRWVNDLIDGRFDGLNR